MYQADITLDEHGKPSYFSAGPQMAYNVGCGDFTVMAMVETSHGGVIVSRKAAGGGDQNGGFKLLVNADGSVTFVTDDGHGYFQGQSGPTPVLDGCCHTIAAIRAGATISIIIDGASVPVTTKGTRTPPLNVNNSEPVTIGVTRQSRDLEPAFIGEIMNVSIWQRALKDGQLLRAAFARVASDEPGLLSYWKLNGSGADFSAMGNTMHAQGAIRYSWCPECVWASGEESYEFCQVSNTPHSSDTPLTVYAVSRHLRVDPDIPFLGMGVMSDDKSPGFPKGLTVVLTDPSGRTYTEPSNTDDLFVVSNGVSPWAVMVRNPMPGHWKVRVEGNSLFGMQLMFQTFPARAPILYGQRALAPLFDPDVPSLYSEPDGVAWSSLIYGVVGTIAFAAVAAAVLGVAVVPVVAVIACLGLVLSVAPYAAQRFLDVVDTDSVPGAVGQMAGATTMVVAKSRLLLFDANVQDDVGTQDIYQQRKKLLYETVEFNAFHYVSTKLFQSQVNAADFKTALLDQSTHLTKGIPYISGCGHGLPYELTGWYAPDDHRVLQSVVSTYLMRSKFTPAMVQGRIFHFFACNCGFQSENKDSPGLGQAMVEAGAIGFFGYKTVFRLASKSEAKFVPWFCIPDIEIDLSLMRGETCGQAFDNAIAKFNISLDKIKEVAEEKTIAALRADRDALVFYGDRGARLTIT